MTKQIIGGSIIDNDKGIVGGEIVLPSADLGNSSKNIVGGSVTDGYEEDNDFWGRFVGSTGGAIGGSIAGAKVGTLLAPWTFGASIPIGAVIGGSIGAYGGSVTGRAIEDKLFDDQDVDWQDAHNDAVVDGIVSALVPMGIGAITKGGSVILTTMSNRAANKLTSETAKFLDGEGAQAAINSAKDLMTQGGHTAAQVSQQTGVPLAMVKKMFSESKKLGWNPLRHADKAIHTTRTNLTQSQLKKKYGEDVFTRGTKAAEELVDAIPPEMGDSTAEIVFKRIAAENGFTTPAQLDDFIRFQAESGEMLGNAYTRLIGDRVRESFFSKGAGALSAIGTTSASALDQATGENVTRTYPFEGYNQQLMEDARQHGIDVYYKNGKSKDEEQLRYELRLKGLNYNNGGYVPMKGLWWSPQSQFKGKFHQHKAAIMEGEPNVPREVILMDKNGNLHSQMWYHDGQRIHRHFADDPIYNGYADADAAGEFISIPQTQQANHGGYIKGYNGGDLVTAANAAGISLYHRNGNPKSESQLAYELRGINNNYAAPENLTNAQILMQHPDWTYAGDVSGGVKGVFSGAEDIVELPGAVYGGIRRGADYVSGKDSYEGQYGYNVDLTPQAVDDYNDASKAKAYDIFMEHYGNHEEAQKAMEDLWAGSEFAGSMVDPTVLATGGASLALKAGSKVNKLKKLDDIAETKKVTDDLLDDIDEYEFFEPNLNDPTEMSAVAQAKATGQPVSFCKPTRLNAGGTVMSYNGGNGKCGVGYESVTAHPDGRVSRGKTHRFTMRQADGSITEHDMTNAQMAQQLVDAGYYSDLAKAKEYVRGQTKAGKSGTMKLPDGLVIQRQMEGQNNPDIRLSGRDKAASDVIQINRAEGAYNWNLPKIPDGMNIEDYIRSLRITDKDGHTIKFMRRKTFDDAVHYDSLFDDVSDDALDRIDEYIDDINKGDIDLSDEAVLKALREGRDVVAYSMAHGDDGYSFRGNFRRNDVKPKEYADPKVVSFNKFKSGPFKSTQSKFKITNATDAQIKQYQRELSKIKVIPWYNAVTKADVVDYGNQKRALIRKIFGANNDLYEDPANAWTSFRVKDPKKKGSFSRKIALLDPIQDGAVTSGRPKTGSRKHTIQQNKQKYDEYLFLKERIRNFYDHVRNLGTADLPSAYEVPADMWKKYDDLHTELFGHRDDYMLDHFNARLYTGQGVLRDAEKALKYDLHDKIDGFTQLHRGHQNRIKAYITRKLDGAELDSLSEADQTKLLEEAMDSIPNLNDGGQVKLHPGARVDTVPAKLRAGSYIVNAPAAQRYAGQLDSLGAAWVTDQPFNDGGDVDAMLTVGEAYLSPEIVQFVGTENLAALNNEGRMINTAYKGNDGNPATMDRGQRVHPNDHQITRTFN